MPVYRPGAWLNPDDRPEWCDIAAAGRFAVAAEHARFDRHYHEGDELWFIASGKARIAIGDDECYVGAGDIVLTGAGTVHDIVAVYEPLAGFFCETGDRPGHRHRTPADATGHEVPARPLPADFPGRSEGNACASR